MNGKMLVAMIAMGYLALCHASLQRPDFEALAPGSCFDSLIEGAELECKKRGSSSVGDIDLKSCSTMCKNGEKRSFDIPDGVTCGVGTLEGCSYGTRTCPNCNFTTMQSLKRWHANLEDSLRVSPGA